MKYIEKNDNVEREYQVYYDEEELKKLLNDIVKNASYRKNGRHLVIDGAHFDGNRVKDGAFLPNGDPIYQDIRNVYTSREKDVYGYNRWNTYVEGVEVTAPKLAYIIEKILSDRNDGIKEFLKYEYHNELISIDERINAAKIELASIDDSKSTKKIKALDKLKKLYENKRDRKDFDANLLREFYLQACSLIGFELVSEKFMRKGSKVLLKDYKNSINK